MTIKELEEILVESLDNPENSELRENYGNSVTEYLKNYKSSDELVTLIVRGIDIDQASNYFDYVESANKSDLQSIWKQIRENKEVSNNKNNNGLKMISGLLSLAFMNSGNVGSLSGNIVTKFVPMVYDEKKGITKNEYVSVIIDYFVENIISLPAFPRWESFEIPGIMKKNLAEIIISCVSNENEEKYSSLLKWTSNGLRIAEKQIEKEKIEEKIPKSKITDLQDIVEHYKLVEKQLHDDEYKIAELNGIIKELREQIDALNLEKNNLNDEISNLNKNVNDLETSVKNAQEEVHERTNINDTFEELKVREMEGMLNDIAGDLKSIYQQVKASEKTEMNIELGEIYRMIIIKIFKILNNKGVRMD